MTVNNNNECIMKTHNIMKNTLLLILGLIICACSSSDDNDEIKQDQIIGVWKTSKEVEVYSNGQEDVYLPSVCELKNRYTFRENGTLYFTNFPESDDPNCEEMVGGLYQSGTWEKIAEYKYRIVLTCMIPNCESITEILDKVTFPNSNTMKIRYDDSDLDDDIAYYYTELVRVE